MLSRLFTEIYVLSKSYAGENSTVAYIHWNTSEVTAEFIMWIFLSTEFLGFKEKNFFLITKSQMWTMKVTGRKACAIGSSEKVHINTLTVFEKKVPAFHCHTKQHQTWHCHLSDVVSLFALHTKGYPEQPIASSDHSRIQHLENWLWTDWLKCLIPCNCLPSNIHSRDLFWTTLQSGLLNTDPSADSRLLSNFQACNFHFLSMAIEVGSTWPRCQLVMPGPPCLDAEHFLQIYNQQRKVGTFRLQPILS